MTTETKNRDELISLQAKELRVFRRTCCELIAERDNLARERDKMRNMYDGLRRSIPINIGVRLVLLTSLLFAMKLWLAL